jgi:hypothetical protein
MERVSASGTFRTYAYRVWRHPTQRLSVFLTSNVAHALSYSKCLNGRELAENVKRYGRHVGVGRLPVQLNIMYDRSNRGVSLLHFDIMLESCTVARREEKLH